jgi:gp16 family phage-associated protein
MTKTRSIEEIRKDFERRGKTFRDWAREHGVSDRIVYGVIHGRFKGRRGQAHRVAVLLGLKDGIVE